MKGIRLLLEALGVSIQPEEIETAWARAKDALPQLAKAFDDLNARQERIEADIKWLRDFHNPVTPKVNGAASSTMYHTPSPDPQNVDN